MSENHKQNILAIPENNNNNNNNNKKRKKNTNTNTPVPLNNIHQTKCDYL